MQKDLKHIIFELTLAALFVILFPVVRKDILAFAFYTVIYFYVISLKRESLGYFGLATLMSLVYMSFAAPYYDYGRNMVSVLGINVYTFLAWSLGLFAAREFFSYFASSLSTTKKILVFAVIFMSSIILLETISYHVLEFRNNPKYPGLPICDCIHTPLLMQFYYLFSGTIFYALTLLLDKTRLHQLYKK